MSTSNYVLFDIGETQPSSDLVLHPEIEVDVSDPIESAPKKTPRFTHKEGPIGKYATEELKGIGSTALGLAETAASMLSGWAGMVPAGFQGLGEKINQAFGGDISDDDIVKHIGQVQESWTYAPKSETGQAMVRALTDSVEKGREWAGNKVYKNVYETNKKNGKSDFEARQEAIKAESQTLFGVDYLMAVMPFAGIKGGRGAKEVPPEQPRSPKEPSSEGGPTAPLEGELIRPGERPTEPQLEMQPKSPIEGEIVRPELPQGAAKEAPYTVFNLEGPPIRTALPSRKRRATDRGEVVTEVVGEERRVPIFDKEAEASSLYKDTDAALSKYEELKKNNALSHEQEGRMASVLKTANTLPDTVAGHRTKMQYLLEEVNKIINTTKSPSVVDSAVIERKRLAKETEKNVEVEELPVEEIEVGRTESAGIISFKNKQFSDVKTQSARLEETSVLKEGDALHKTEAELNAELNLNKIPDGPDIGMSTKRVVEDAPSKIEITDRAVEAFFKETKGEKKAPIKERASDFMQSLWHKMSRTYEHLPNTAEFSELKYGLKQLEKSKGIVSDRTVRLIDSVTYDLGPNNYDVFRKKLVLDDLHFTSTQNKELPRGFTKEQIIVAKQHIDQSIVNNPRVLRALEKRKQIWDSARTDVIKAYADIGINVDNVFNNPDYFRHLILDKTRAQIIQGTGSKLKVPRGRGYTKKRKGSELDFNTEYIQAEYEVLSGLLNDINIAKTVKLVNDKYNIRPQLEQQFGKEWSRNIPEGHSVYKSDPGHALYLRYTIPESIAEQMFTAAAEQLGIPKETIQKNLTLRRDSPNMVVKDEIALTLDNLIKTTKDHPFVTADKKLTRGWKVWTLTSPRRLFKYNVRNITGDAEAAFIGNPSTFRELKTATGELYDVMALGKAPEGALKEWLDRGGMQSTLQAAELGDINKLALFKRLQEKKGTLSEIPEKVWQGYWKTARISTDFREAMFRYAAFRDYVEQMKNSTNGKPNNYGGSIREEVDALPNIYDRADKLSNDLLGNYTEISSAGQAIRDHVFPFWSFQEINFKRYFRFIDNAMQDGILPEMIGRKLTGTMAKTPLMVARVGLIAAKMAVLWSVLEAYNNTFFQEEEEELPNYIQDGPHIVLGRNTDGSVNYFGNLGILGDFVTWFGFNAAPEGIRDWYAGRKSIAEVTQQMAKQPVNKVAQSSFPFVKLAYEEITGTTTYPNVFEPKHIRDKSRHLAKFLGLEKEYDSVSDRPSVPYHKTLPGFLYYSVNSGEAAYSNVYELKKEYLRKIGKASEGYLITPAATSLYNFKLAIKYKDKEAADKYMLEYTTNGGNIRGLATSLRNMHPLAGIPEEHLPNFANTLSERDAEDLKRALAFYITTLNPMGIQ